jgi:phage baseplate assembly protein gpV
MPQDPRWRVLSFNISVSNATSSVNIVVKAGGVELQRYSLTNQPIHVILETVIPQGGNIKAGGNVIEFKITDTPTTETDIIKISDVVF